MDYAALQQRVATDLNRPDLLTAVPPSTVAVIPAYISDRIGYYQKALFQTSNQLDYSISAVESQSIYPLPAGFQALINVRLLLDSIWLPITRVPYEQILAMDVVQPPYVTLPAQFAQFGATFRLFPTPDRAYPLELMGNDSPPAPVTADTQNFWTDDGPRGAATLIIVAACAEICRRALSDYDRAEQYTGMTRREEMSMQEMTQRLQGPVQIDPYYS